MTDKAGADVASQRDPFERLLDAIAWLCQAITGTAMVVLTVIFGWLVYGRYVLNATPTWVEQVSLLLVVFIAFIGAAVGVRQNTHLCVDMFRNRLPETGRRGLKYLVHAVMLAFGAVMAWYGTKLAIFKWSTPIPLIDLPEGLRTVPVAICGALLVLFSAGHIWRLWRGLPDYALPDEE